MYKSIKITDKIAKPDALAVALFDKTKKLPAAYDKLDKSCGGALSSAIGRAEFTAGAGSVACVYTTKGPGRVYILGLGEKGNGDLVALRSAAASLTAAAARARVKSIDIHVTPALDKPDAELVGRALGEALELGNLAFDERKGSTSPKKDGLKSLTVAVEKSLYKPAKRGVTIAESANASRRLAATPPNVCNPGYLVKYCRKMAQKTGLSCSVIDAKKAKAMGMGGLTAVGSGGSTPPALICLEHKPRGAKNKKPLVLVGKAITFDTGGYSIKPPTSMVRMKYDKCGGMAVLGAMHAAATLKLPVHVVGLIATAENMIDAASYRVDDILTMYNGVTVEITNTDAEGRLVLADALAYGCKHYKPAAMVELSTLTGGVVVALGEYCAGAFCNDEKLRKQLFDAGADVGERLWRLPLWKEHRRLMRSSQADIVNSGIREAHPIQGAVFLSYFVEENVPWAHLDIAGVADIGADRDWTGLFPKGPTAFGVRLLVRAMEQWK
ncbi:MAG: leucyl aminopeptidase [Planctomycetes bacterium]|nr:leucyl aminopeptidase [Planctomycetota bacterium]